jgi:hypothetical protein
MTLQQPECAVGPTVTVGACVRAGLSLLWLLLKPQKSGPTGPQRAA